MNYYQAAALASLPGATTEVRFHPDRLTVRMRNMVQKMLDANKITGGYQSKAKAIAEQIYLLYGAYTAEYREGGACMRADGPLPDNVRDVAKDAVKASKAAARLDQSGRTEQWPKQFEHELYNRGRLYENQHGWTLYADAEFVPAVYDEWRKWIATTEQADKIAQAAADFRAGKVMVFTTHE